MKQRILEKLGILILILCFAQVTQAQVTIGSGIAPSRAALLDLKQRQSTGVINTVGDDDNVTSDKGGLLLPRVKLVSTNTLQPFIEATDPEWVDPAKQKSLRLGLAGLMVYNIATVGTSLYPGLYTWDGEKWATSQANPSAGVEISEQPQAFSFYETGTETVEPLTFTVSGATGTVNYQWYMITGSNVHVRVGVPVTGGSGGKTPTYTPTQVIKGTTRNANNTGFYKFYCIATDSYGKELESAIAEVAVGCGAKNNAGEWLSFMCFNLGADNNSTIDSQINYPIGSFTNDPSGLHTYIQGEENLWGDLFQWGRIPDGHEDRQSPTQAFNSLTTSDIGNGKRCGVNDNNRPHQQVKKTSMAYQKFIISGLNWTTSTDQATIDGLWRAGRFIANDPCAHYKIDGSYQEFWHEGIDLQNNGDAACTDAATAWRTPSREEWGEIFKGGSITGSANTATANTWKWNNTNGRGFEVRPDGETSTLFLPGSGYRNASGGNLISQGDNGFYWSISISGATSSAFVFSNGNLSPARDIGRSAGLTVRCIKNT